MPYKIAKEGNKFCVHKENADKSLGEKLHCYDNQEQAVQYLRALYANVKESVHELNMYITKSTLSDGVMRWSAVNSDTEKDLYGERMSLDLYHKMLSYIKNDTPPPDNFKDLVVSDFWNGGMPYLSIAHYPDGNGKAVPGKPEVLYVDGKELKAKGILFDTPLGQAVWKSLKEDEIKTKSSSNVDRIRISIAFLDLAHKHGESGQVFQRNSLNDVCPDCKNRIGDKIYVDGYLVHLALTRVPVNPRSIMQVERSMSKIKTRKQDAVSIVGDESLVDEIEKSNLETKSDILVEMSDTDETVVEESQASKMMENGKKMMAKGKQMKDQGMMDDAQKMMDKAKSMSSGSLVEESGQKPKVANEQVPASEEEDIDDSVVDNGKEEPSPVGKQKKSLTEEDIPEIIRSVVLALAKTNGKNTTTTPVDESEDTETVEEPESDTASKKKVQKSALDLATEKLYTSVKSAIETQGVTLEQKLESINPTLQELGNSITAMVRDSMGQLAPVPVSNEQTVIMEAITNLTQKIENIALEVTTLKSQPTAPITQNRVPVPRSISPTLVAQSQATQKPINPNSVDNIARRSVSSQIPLK